MGVSLSETSTTPRHVARQLLAPAGMHLCGLAEADNQGTVSDSKKVLSGRFAIGHAA